MNMFDSSKKVPSAPKAREKTREEIQTKGLEEYAVIDAAIVALTALRDAKGAALKEAMKAHFVQSGMGLKAQPANYCGVDGAATASMELRRRSSSSALSGSEIEVMDANDIPYENVVVTVDTFVINPTYATNPKILRRVEKALKDTKGVPEDLFLKQDGISRKVVAANALEEIFKLKKSTDVELLLDICATMAIKPSIDVENVKDAIGNIEGLDK